MKKLMLYILALAALSAATLPAQSLAGTWQGTLAAGKDLRLVFKISTTDADTLKGVMYSIDQPGPGIPASAITLQGSTVKVAVAGIGATYEGKLDADGKSITGTWSQGPKPLPLNLVRATDQTAWTIPEPPARPKPMAADAVPVFEVATIKVSNPEARGKGFRVNGRQFSTINTSLSDLITFAYDLHARQITGGPPWLETAKYDLAAKPDGEGQPNDKQWKTMVQKLLKDRFQLTFHQDSKEIAVYTVTLGKAGPKLTKSEGDPDGLPGIGFRGLGALIARNATMGDFARAMQGTALDRPVMDRTGIAGRYDFTLTWTPEVGQFNGLGLPIPQPAENADSPPDLFVAIQQQLGLKLESARSPAPVLVIDGVEKPSEN